MEDLGRQMFRGASDTGEKAIDEEGGNREDLPWFEDKS
jgi:hypothetical protein